MNKPLLVVTLASMSVVSAAPAHGEVEDCRSDAAFINHYEQEYGEVPILAGSSHTGNIFVLFYNPRNSSWTIAKGDLDRHILCRTDNGHDLMDLTGEAAGAGAKVQ